MRRIPRRPRSSKAWEHWVTECAKAAEELAQCVARGEKPEIGKLYKLKSIKNEYFFAAGPPFFGKCAYCEVRIKGNHRVDVEHFRPKAEVTDENGRPVYLLDDEGNVVLDANGVPVKHPGYYWLAYDWTNLLPACADCDQAWKRTRFPVEGRHAQRPEEVAQEEPLLIHPLSDREADDPSHHLLVDTETGVMCPRTPRGEACIEILGLKRDPLVMDRWRACLAAEALWLRVRRNDRAEAALNEMTAILRGERPFTAAQTATLRKLAERDGIVPVGGA